jgi:hypothetical protein
MKLTREWDADDLRQFIDARWKSRRAAARDLGVSDSLIYMILSGTRTLSNHVRVAAESILLNEQLVALTARGVNKHKHMEAAA